MEQGFETMWRMAKLAGGIDTTVRLIETVIETAPTLKFRNTAGKEMPIRDLAGLARSVQAGTSVPQGASFDQRDVQFLENKFTACRDDATFCDACGRDMRTVLAGQAPHGEGWATSMILLVIFAVGAVWFLFMR